MINYWKLIIIQILQSSIIVYALLEETTKYPGRKFSTAHSFPNNTVYILGGLVDLPENRFESWTMFDLNQTDYSLHLNNHTNLLRSPPTIGHTSHLHVPSNTIISVFGMQPNQTESPPLIPSFASLLQGNNTSPTGRYKHSSILINNELLYVIGGEQVKEKKLIESHDLIWNYSFSTNKWKRLDHQQQHPTMAGHISLVYNQWIISCFGYQQDISVLHNNSCTWFDTNTFQSTIVISPTGTTLPSSRKFSNLVSIGNDTHILYGGENDKEGILSDVWKLYVNDTFKMTWERVNTTSVHKRSGHASTLLSNQNIILYYGGQQEADNPIYLNLSNMDWIQSDHHHLTRISRADVLVEEEDPNTNNSTKLNGGIIAAIIVGILVIFGLLIAFFVWKKRVNRQQSIHQQSRAARFSHSPAPMQSVQEDYTNNNTSSSSLPQPNLVSLPELALSRHSNKSHASVISVDANLQAPTAPEIIKEEEVEQPQPTNNRDYKRRESTGFKRLTLNLFSSQDESTPKKSSTLSQLRSSKLLLQATTNDSMNKIMNNSRVSVGAKSVSSVQWVGFNDNMDYKGNHWRDSSNSSMHLAVTNAQRASSYYTNESTTSTPKSPLFASHLRDSHLRDSSAIHYQFSEHSDTSSWKSDQIVDKSSSFST